MSSGTITTRDGTSIFYKDWGSGQPVIFSHGWPLSGEDWEEQMYRTANQGYRVIAHDRRGHGRSSQPWEGHDLTTVAADLAQLVEQLDLRDVILVGHSTGGSEITRYVAQHGQGRVAKLVTIDAPSPLMLQTPTNPKGQPKANFDQVRTSLEQDRAQFYEDLSIPFYGANRQGAKVSQGLRDQFWRLSMQCNFVAAYEGVTMWSETDLTDDLKQIDQLRLPMLIIHGEDDQIAPLADTSELAVKLVKHATLKIYPGAPHGLPKTHAAQLNTDLAAFFKS
ncbi:MAG: alpha/beta hydrolase [Ktedonobacterales bacterium]|nr:alpha/beta hydrolase [Ktedonobacterales bacterium]